MINQYCQRYRSHFRPRKAAYKLVMEKQPEIYVCEECFVKHRAEFKDMVAHRFQTRRVGRVVFSV